MAQQIQQRKQSPVVYSSAREQGYTHLQASLLASRLDDQRIDLSNLSVHVSPSLSNLDSPMLLPDIAKAASRIAEAIIEGQTISIASDFDCDGATSHCVLVDALTNHFGVPRTRIKSFISHRMVEGYGITDALVDRMMEQIPSQSLVITSDQGSTDEARIARLKAAGVDTVVTDHHMIPADGPPKSAVACVNPMREDSQYPDRAIAGCYVAWLTMCAVRRVLIEMGRLPKDAPTLASSLDWVALGTTADCMDLAISRNNRAVIRYGLWLMNTRPRQCWKSLASLASITDPFTSRDLAFQAAPRINARGRLSEAMTSAVFLMTDDPAESMELLQLLDEENKKRRVIQDTMAAEGYDVAKAQFDEGMSAIVVFYPEGHSGVHGIVSSKYVEAFGRPVVCFSPKPNAPGKLSGSFRSVEGVHIRNALQLVADRNPGIFLAMGGHAGAAGASLDAHDLDRFSNAFRQAVREQLDPGLMAPRLMTDGALEEPPTVQMLSEIAALEPFGRQFDAPTFSGEFTADTVKAVGDGRTLKLVFSDGRGHRYDAVWFRAREDAQQPLPIAPGDRLMAAYTLKSNTFRGRTSADMIIQRIFPLHAA